MTETAVLVNGAPASLAEAAQAAATLLAGSRLAVVAGLGTDVAGTRASIALARAVGGCIDHMDADAVFANLDVMRRAGWIVTTPLQVRARADTVLLVGDGLTEAWPGMAERLGLEVPPTLLGGVRRVLRLDSGAVGDLATLRALLAGRRVMLDEAAAEPLRVLAGALAAARFGVVVWSATAMDTLAIEMLCGLVDDLNRKTRFAGLPLVPGNGAEGVVQTAAWSTGFPVRTGFAGADPVHDPWRFDAARLVASGEADTAVWVSALSAVPVPWGDAVPTIALVAAGTVFDVPPAVVVEVGCPGRDHDAMLYDQGLGGIAFAAASAGRVVPTVAETMMAILAALPSC